MINNRLLQILTANFLCPNCHFKLACSNSKWYKCSTCKISIHTSYEDNHILKLNSIYYSKHSLCINLFRNSSKLYLFDDILDINQVPSRFDNYSISKFVDLIRTFQ